MSLLNLAGHSSDFIMSAMASQFTGVSIVCSTVCSSADQRNMKASGHWPLWREFTSGRWISLTRDQERANVSIWWRHHGYIIVMVELLQMCWRASIGSYVECSEKWINTNFDNHSWFTRPQTNVWLTRKLLETHRCELNTAPTDALVLKHLAISIHRADKMVIVLNQIHPQILHLWLTTLEIEITFWNKKWPGCLWVNSSYRIYACVNWVSIGPGNGLSPVRLQAITWTNADLLSIVPFVTNCGEIWIEIQNISFTKDVFEKVVAEITVILSRGGGDWKCNQRTANHQLTPKAYISDGSNNYSV